MWAVLEARDAIGGTWDLFRYPGIRSDSDMYTLGFPFRPWRGASSIATGMRSATTSGPLPTTRGSPSGCTSGSRSSGSSGARPTAAGRVSRTRDGPVRHTARFVYLATGYFSYASGHVVDFPGQDDFAGEVVHPQAWPDGMPVAGRRVLVIGSGATAVTLLPALADEGAAHVTMLQRSPSYIAALPSRDVVADGLRAVLPDAVAHRIVRGKNVVLSTAGYQVLRRHPEAGRRLLRRRALRRLPDGYPVDTHFAPRYDPWDQRLCVAPDGDLFDVLSDGRAQVVTGTIERFERDGIRLTSGELLEADVVVTATGLQMQIGGGAELVVDGEPVDLSRGHVYKGLMLSEVPNVAMAVGYTNASWTLRADLSARWFCSLLRYLDRHHLTVATPRYDEPEVGNVRCSTSRRAMCSGRRTCCRARGSTGPGGWCRATCTTSR